MKTFVCLILCLVLAAPVYAETTSGTVTVYPSNGKLAGEGPMHWVRYDWVSTGGTSAQNNDVNFQASKLRAIIFDPDEVTSSPSANYDVVLTDPRGIDVLMNLGQNRHTTTTQALYFGSPAGTASDAVTVNTNNIFYPWVIPTQGTMTLSITNAGTKKAGSITIFTEE